MLFKFSKLHPTYKAFYEALIKSQSRQQSMMRPLFSLPTAEGAGFLLCWPIVILETWGYDLKFDEAKPPATTKEKIKWWTQMILPKMSNRWTLN